MVQAQAMVTRKFLALTMKRSVRVIKTLKKTLTICIWMCMMCQATLTRLRFCGSKLQFRVLFCATCVAVSVKSPRCLRATKAPQLPKMFLMIARLPLAFSSCC